MSAELNNLSALREVPQTEQTEQVEAKNISYRANPNNTLERTPDGDYYDKQRKKKTIGIVAGLILTVAAVVGGICWHKGKPADGGEKKFFDRLKDGWKELTGKGKKAAEDGADKAGDAADGAKTEAESAAEKTVEAASGAKSETGNAAEKAAEAINIKEITENDVKEYISSLSGENKTNLLDMVNNARNEGKIVTFVKTEEGNVVHFELPEEKFNEVIEKMLPNLSSPTAPEAQKIFLETYRESLKNNYVRKFDLNINNDEELQKSLDYFENLLENAEVNYRKQALETMSKRETMEKILKKELGEEEYNKLTREELDKSYEEYKVSIEDAVNLFLGK